MQEIAENVELPPQSFTSATGSIWFRVRAIFVAEREGIIQRVEDAAARQHKIPSLSAVQIVITSHESRFVVGNRFVQAVIPGGCFRLGVVEICNTDARQ